MSPRPSSLTPALLPALLLAIASCGPGEEGPDAAPPDANPFCLEATNHSDLPWLQEHIFTPSCSDFTVCHMGRALMAGELSLEDGKSHDELVDVDSTLFPEFKRVVAGDPANSYLMIILGQYEGPIDPMAGTMPYRNPLLCQEMRDAIERWIVDGALTGEEPDAGL